MIWKVEDGEVFVDEKLHSQVDPDASEEHKQDGWYFSDEVDQPIGPYESQQAARDALEKYAQEIS